MAPPPAGPAPPEAPAELADEAPPDALAPAGLEAEALDGPDEPGPPPALAALAGEPCWPPAEPGWPDDEADAPDEPADP